MTYSYTQISQYLTCPRRYRYRYLDGWQEKDSRAALLFGRAFEQALAAWFRGEDAMAIWQQNWALARQLSLTYTARDSWERLLEQGYRLLESFVRDRRVEILDPWRQQQVRFTRRLPSGAEFVSVIDALGTLDGRPCVLEWKTAAASLPTKPEGLVALDPQLVCYSWISGIDEVAEVVFVRTREVQIQYLRATISEQQRRNFAELVNDTIERIESARFLAQSGIRFPQNPCTSCPFLGLCLDQPELAAATLVRATGVDLGLFDDLCE